MRPLDREQGAGARGAPAAANAAEQLAVLPVLRYSFEQMDVTYDSEKNRRNINLRHLPLSLGGLVQEDTQRIERHDVTHSTPEENRWQTIGLAGKLLFTVYIEGSEKPHIISVRLADAEERRLYYGDSNLQAGRWFRVNPGRNGDA